MKTPKLPIGIRMSGVAVTSSGGIIKTSKEHFEEPHLEGALDPEAEIEKAKKDAEDDSDPTT